MPTPDLRPFALAGAVVLTLVACDSDRSISTSPAGPPAYGVALALAPSNLPRGSVTFRFNTIASPTDDSIEVTLDGLDTLENGYYTIWLSDSAAAVPTRATGLLRVIRTDTAFDALGDPIITVTTTDYPGTSSFSNGGPRSSIRFFTSRRLSGRADADSLQMVFVTVEDAANPSAPNATRRPLWATRLSGTAPVRISNFLFGNFDPTVANRFVFSPQGRGRAYIRGTAFVVNDTNLTRPPLGYYYAVFAERLDSATNMPTDTIYLGELTSAAQRSISLRNADSIIVDPRVQIASPPSILAASNRVEAADVGLTGPNPYRHFARVYVTLESKNASDTRMGPAILLRADLPGIVRFPKP